MFAVWGDVVVWRMTETPSVSELINVLFKPSWWRTKRWEEHKPATSGFQTRTDIGPPTLEFPKHCDVAHVCLRFNRMRSCLLCWSRSYVTSWSLRDFLKTAKINEMLLFPSVPLMIALNQEFRSLGLWFSPHCCTTEEQHLCDKQN